MSYFKSSRHEFIAQFLWRVRNARGWSQERMAEHLNITSRALSNLETGKSLPGAETLLHLDQMLTPDERDELRQGIARCLKEEAERE